MLEKYIVLYLMFKLKFITGRTIIICKNIEEVYKVFMFLKNTKIPYCHIFNPHDPKNLR